MNQHAIETIVERHFGSTFPAIALRISRGSLPLCEIIRGDGMERDTLFDVASLTKPLATTIALSF